MISKRLAIALLATAWMTGTVSAGSSTVWSDTFATDLEANTEFHRTLETEGISSFLQPPPPRELN